MQQYKFTSLMIELTRKCNLSCKHCMRGDAQDVTITREIIDTIFENVGDCSRFSFTGGEPLLALDELEYFVDRIIESGYNTNVIDLVTNGTVMDRRIMDVFEKFCYSRKGREAHLLISNDRFHLLDKSREAFNYYRNISADIPGVKVDYNGDFSVEPDKDGSFAPIVLAGRARELSPCELPCPTIKESVSGHRLLIGSSGAVKGLVFCMLEILANGNVVDFEQRSYRTKDAIAMGNILQTPLYEIITNHQANCLITCPELQYLESCENHRALQKKDAEGKTEVDILIMELCLDVCAAITRRIIIARKQAHSAYPAIPSQEVIKNLPIFDPAVLDLLQEYTPTGDAPLDYINQESRKSIEKARELIAQDASQSDKLEMLSRLEELIAILDAPGMKTISRDTFWGGAYFFCTEEFRRLKDLNELYTSGRLKGDNSAAICNYEKNLSDYVVEQMRTNINSDIWRNVSDIFRGLLYRKGLL